MSEQVKKAAVEAARVMVLSVIPILIVQIEAGAFQLWAVLSAALIALLRFVDKYLHEKGKADGNEVMAKGITRF